MLLQVEWLTVLLQVEGLTVLLQVEWLTHKLKHEVKLRKNVVEEIDQMDGKVSI